MRTDGRKNWADYEARTALTAALAFLADRGPARTWERYLQIQALPLVVWKGRTLRTLSCQGQDKGPHPFNVSEAVCWALLDLGWFSCPFHH